MEHTTPTIVHNVGSSRFELHAGGPVAFLEYQVTGDRLRLMHVEVPPELRGHRYSDDLARAALEYAKSQHLRVVPFCPAVRAYLARHPEYEALIDEHWRAALE
jgi:predicted GNAT family acetyltransferase